MPIPAISEAQLLKDTEVCNLLSIGRSTLWEGVKANKYPRPIKLGNNTRWLFKDILEFIFEKEKEEALR